MSSVPGGGLSPSPSGRHTPFSRVSAQCTHWAPCHRQLSGSDHQALRPLGVQGSFRNRLLYLGCVLPTGPTAGPPLAEGDRKDVSFQLALASEHLDKKE